jgi:hypothetical protein
MKTLLLSLTLAVAATSLGAATTISADDHFAYGANVGWMDCRGDVNNGAVIGEFVCSGFVWAANVGWISLGHGTPVNGMRYQNNSTADFGVNHDGAGNLAGYAWGANIGWITFTNRTDSGSPYDGPKVDLLTGQLSGLVWSANVGWISLSNLSASVRTLTLAAGTDSDGDGIPDAWELTHFANLAAASSSSDLDRDGFSDLSEYLADTDPNDPNSNLRITHYAASSGGSPADITWTSRSTRQYRVLKRGLADTGSWLDVGLGLLNADAGGSTSRSFADPPSDQSFYRIESLKPLSP